MNKELYNFLSLCDKYKKIDIDYAYNLTLNTIKYYKGSKFNREMLRNLQEIEAKWYESLEKGSPDYSLYNSDYFMCEMWACWIVYSSGYLKKIAQTNKLSNGTSILQDLYDVKSIVDMGCGFGHTTGEWKRLIPSASVYGMNLRDTFQFNIAERTGQEKGFKMVGDIKEIGKNMDLVFASEYFEHIEKPLEHLLEVITVLKPKVFIIANSFGSKSMGHFNEYIVNNQKVSNKSIGRLFNKLLRDNDYYMVKTKLWNNRPTYWRRKLLM